VVDAGEAAKGAAWLERIEEENADELTPERIAAMEAAAVTQEALGNGQALPMAGAPKAKRIELDEDVSPTEGRRFTRA
jgi:(E)-4-hydroxy-3-methylbut-2-enyl-diphosphate synthase